MQIKVSPKYQIAIPKEIRELIHLKAGQKLDIMIIGDSIRLVPIRKIKDLFGKFSDIKGDVEREDDRELS